MNGFFKGARAKRLSEGDVVGGAPCCKAIHITLGFDGTNNNDKADGSSVYPSCSNVARLIHASIGGGDDINSRGFLSTIAQVWVRCFRILKNLRLQTWD